MPRARFRQSCSALAIVALAAPAFAHAQEMPDTPAISVSDPATALVSGSLVYGPSDFEQYAPRSALDMLQQVPGFNIRESFGQGRGLGEATGNVLINGERISSKTDTVTQRLSRIVAAISPSDLIAERRVSAGGRPSFT